MGGICHHRDPDRSNTARKSLLSQGPSPNHFSRLGSACIAILATTLLLANTSVAEHACDGSIILPETLRAADAPVPTGPPSNLRPSQVEINLQITEFDSIDEVNSHFRFEGYGNFRWCDPRMAFDADAEGQNVRRYFGTARETPHWNVNLTVANSIGAVQVTRRLIEIYSDGSIRVSGYFNSKVATVFDLRQFPFDEQTFEIQIESFTYNNEMIELVTNDDRIGYEPDLYLPEWRITGIDTRVEDTLNVRDLVPFSRVVIGLQVAREWGFYVYKLWVPLFLIVALSWSVFWMQGESLANRIRMSATAFLTIVAYQFAISGSLPKVAYLTLMDRLMVASFVLIALTALQSMLVVKLAKAHPERAVQLDRMSRWLFPLGYLGIIAGIAMIHMS
jgi:hypothetical protein